MQQAEIERRVQAETKRLEAEFEAQKRTLELERAKERGEQLERALEAERELAKLREVEQEAKRKGELELAKKEAQEEAQAHVSSAGVSFSRWSLTGCEQISKLVEEEVAKKLEAAAAAAAAVPVAGPSSFSFGLSTSGSTESMPPAYDTGNDVEARVAALEKMR